MSTTSSAFSSSSPEFSSNFTVVIFPTDATLVVLSLGGPVSKLYQQRSYSVGWLVVGTVWQACSTTGMLLVVPIEIAVFAWC